MIAEVLPSPEKEHLQLVEKLSASCRCLTLVDLSKVLSVVVISASVKTKDSISQHGLEMQSIINSNFSFHDER